MNEQIFKKNIEYLTGETKQNKIADKLNVSESKISKWFSGNLLPTLEDLLTIAEEYNCSIDWLIGQKKNSRTALSVYEVCKQITDLARGVFTCIEVVKAIEPYTYYDPNKEYEEGEELETQEIEVERPIIYFSNSAALFPHDSSEKYHECYTIANGDSILLSHAQINEFLIKYSKLNTLYEEGLIPGEFFWQIIDDMLNTLDKHPIAYWPQNDPDKNISTPSE